MARQQEWQATTLYEMNQTLLRQIRELSEVPIIILSAGVGEREKITNLGAGADDYLIKPFGMGELLARLRGERGRVKYFTSLRATWYQGKIFFNPAVISWPSLSPRLCASQTTKKTPLS